MKNKEAIVKIAKEVGFSSCSFARLEKNSEGARLFGEWLQKGFAGEMHYLERGQEKRRDPSLVLENAKSVIVLAWDYVAGPAAPHPQIRHRSQGSLLAEFGGPPVASPAASSFISRYAWGKDYHEILGEKLSIFQKKLEEIFPGEIFKSYVDTGPVMEKYWSALGGLGWLGKHTNLIHEKRGSYFLLASLLTTLDFESEAPVIDRCGTCTRCIDVCPTRAIVAPYVLDARLCISYLTIELKGSIPLELRPLIGNHVFGCDDCQEVCPWNRHARLPEEFLRNTSIEQLLEWLSLDEKQFKEKFRGSPILRSKRRGFLRNVCVVLGNLKDPKSIPALQKAAQDSEPLIREHAQWALGKMKI